MFDAAFSKYSCMRKYAWVARGESDQLIFVKLSVYKSMLAKIVEARKRQNRILD